MYMYTYVLYGGMVGAFTNISLMSNCDNSRTVLAK